MTMGKKIRKKATKTPPVAPWPPFPVASSVQSEKDATDAHGQGYLKMRRILEEQETRIRQLEQEIVSCNQENEKITAENRRQNEEFRRLNQSLDQNGKNRTRELQETTEKLEQQNLELQELSESKEAMMHMIVHDLKNPLTTVMGALCLSQNKRFEFDPGLRELLLGAHVQSIKLRAMIDDILTISQLRSQEFTAQAVPTNLVSLIQQSVMLMDTIKSLKTVTLRFESRRPEVVADIDYPMVERVLNNLINNALKYAPRESEILVELDTDDAWARIAISNQGEAIPKAAHAKIFELFGRAKPQDKTIQGTGLGLAFCKLAVEAHGGGIQVESPLPELDHGARFVFTLPLHTDP